MPPLRHYYLFISHAWRYGGDYERMVQLLNAAPNFTYRNFSVPRAKSVDGNTDAQLKTELRDQMRPAQVIVVLAGMYASYSKWIDFEIKYALDTGKPILGVHPWGSQRTPAAVSFAANEMVNWSTSSIVSGIRRLAR